MGSAPSYWSVEGDFYHVKTRALPSGRVWGSLCPLRQRPGHLPSEKDHGNFSQKKTEVLPSETRASRLRQILVTSIIQRAGQLLSDQDPGAFPQTVPRASPLGQSPR